MGCSSSVPQEQSSNTQSPSQQQREPSSPKSSNKSESASTNKNLIGPIHAGSICGICIDGGKVLTAGDDKRVACFNQTSGKQKIKRFEGHVKAVNKVVASGEYAWSISKDLSILQVVKKYP